jgi:hypothetical protein
MQYIASIYSLDAKSDSELDTARRNYRYEYVMKRTHELMEDGNMAFSPITHCHPMAEKYGAPKDYEYYQTYDRHMIDSSDSVIVLDMKTFNGKSWIDSEGVSDEVAYAKETGKPVIFLSCPDFYDNVIIRD